MVYRRRTFRRRKRSFGRRSTRGRGRGRRMRSMLPPDTRIFCKLRYVFPLSSDAGGNIIGYASCSNPTTAVNGAGTYQEWGNFILLYDLYRIHAIRMHFIPDKPFDTSITTAYRPLYVVHDIDNSGSNMANANEAIEYSNMKAVNMNRPWVIYRRLPRITNQQKTVGSYNSVGTAINVGALQWFGNQFDTSDNYGTLIFTMYVTFKNRR